MSSLTVWTRTGGGPGCRPAPRYRRGGRYRAVGEGGGGVLGVGVPRCGSGSRCGAVGKAGGSDGTSVMGCPRNTCAQHPRPAGLPASPPPSPLPHQARWPRPGHHPVDRASRSRHVRPSSGRSGAVRAHGGRGASAIIAHGASHEQSEAAGRGGNGCGAPRSVGAPRARQRGCGRGRAGDVTGSQIYGSGVATTAELRMRMRSSQ